MPHGEVERRTVEAKDYADRYGYGASKAFYEWDARLQPALNELIATIQRHGGKYVIIPSLNNFTGSRILQSEILERLIATTKITVIIMDAA